MPKSFCIHLVVLLLFLPSLTVLAEKETLAQESGQNASRQIPPFPGLPPGVPIGIPGQTQFPEAGMLACYIPYRVQFKTPRDGVINIILVKKLVEEYEPEAPIHEKAKESITLARNRLWLKWQRFKSDLEYNQENIAKEIAESSDLIKVIKNKKMWKKPLAFNSSNSWKEPEEVNLINQGTSDSTHAVYPVGYVYPKESEVCGLAVRYERGNFAPLYDIDGAIADNYWGFVTEYVRKYGTAIFEPDWDNPEGCEKPVELPPATFNTTR